MNSATGTYKVYVRVSNGWNEVNYYLARGGKMYNWYRIHFVNSQGPVVQSAQFVSKYRVRPIVVLRADLTIKSGNGSKDSPYVLSSQ